MKEKIYTIKKIKRLSICLDFNIFTSLLVIRHASKEFIPAFSQLTINDILGNNAMLSVQTPWHIVALSSKDSYVDSITRALSYITPQLPLFIDLKENIKSTVVDENILEEMIELLSNISLDDIPLIQVYEDRLSMETKDISASSGDFFTPFHINHLLFKLLDVKGGDVYDPCCGSGSMLYVSSKLSEGLNLYGQTLGQMFYQICQTNFFLQDISIDLGGKPANTLIEDLHSGRKFDYVLSNPPFNLSKWNCGLDCEDDSRWKYGVPPESNANYAWIQHIVSHLSDDGCAAVILPNGTLTTQVKLERIIRYNILHEGLVEAIITLPANIFYGTKVPCCIWILRKQKKNNPRILMVDARGFDLTNDNLEIQQEICKITELILRYRSNDVFEKTDWYSVVSLEDIAKENYILSPNLYTKKQNLSLEKIKNNKQRFIKVIDELEDFIGNNNSFITKWRDLIPSDDWKNSLLTELYRVSGGLVKKKDDFGNGIKIVDVNTVINNTFIPDNLPKCVNASEEEIEKFRISTGDILLNRTSETISQLACCLVATEDREIVYDIYIKRLRPIKDCSLNPLYMAGYFKSDVYRQEVINVMPVYTIKANINMERLSRIKVYYLDMEMQNMIGNTLFDISKLKNNSEICKKTELLDEFERLLIEQFITYPIVNLQMKEVDCK